MMSRCTTLSIILIWINTIIHTSAFQSHPFFHTNSRPSFVLSSTSSTATARSIADNSNTNKNNDFKVSVKATELDKEMGLSEDERTIVNVHRTCSPSVVYVTSVLTSRYSSALNINGGRRRSRWNGSITQNRGRQRGKRDNDKEDKNEENSQRQGMQRLPQGVALGSGSGFVVDADGYVITNYHVIQRAYEANEAMMKYSQFWGNLKSNVTQNLEKSLGISPDNFDTVERFVNQTVNAIVGDERVAEDTVLPAQIFVRFGTNGNDDGSGSSSGAFYRPCEIVDVVKELDVAVLRIQQDGNDKFQPLHYGSSANLLVGQTLLAIGNPFGLDRTITSGIVSALGRSVTGVAGNEIRNCVQTDAAINPGNSGGPLLDLRGKVVGVNTMIVTTSGSSAGIGFAVPGDKVNQITAGIVDMDKERRRRGRNNGEGRKKGRGWLGVEVATGSLEESLRKRLPLVHEHIEGEVLGAFITNIDEGSPINDDDDAFIAPTRIKGGNVVTGDRVVDFGGKSIWNGMEFLNEMKERVEGEKVTLTLEDSTGDKRVVYVTLGSIPL